MYTGTSSSCARSKIGQKRLSSSHWPLERPWIIAPLKPSRVTARSSSSAAAFGSAVGSAAKPSNRLGGGLHDLQEPVVGAPRDRDRGLGVHALRGGRRVRQHLHVDAGFVHLADAQLADVEEPVAQLGQARFGPSGLEVLGDVGVEVVLFEGDDLRLFHQRHPVG